MQAIYVADIVLLLVLSALMVAVCAYGGWWLWGARGQWTLILRLNKLKEPPTDHHIQQIQHIQHQSPQRWPPRYQRAPEHGHAPPDRVGVGGYMNPVAEYDRYGVRSPVTSQLSSNGSAQYEPLVAPLAATTVQDNRLRPARDWRYTEYQI